MRINNDHIIYGLAFQCPYQNRQDDCPLANFDDLTFMEKIILIDEMDQEFIDMIKCKYKYCKNKEYNTANNNGTNKTG